MGIIEKGAVRRRPSFNKRGRLGEGASAEKTWKQ